MISAALVLDVNTDQTLQQARARILATLIGSALGIGVLAASGNIAVWASLAIVLTAMAAIAAYRPAWSYGIVAASALALGSPEDRWGVALDRGIAIAIGASVGLIVAFSVWPASAQERARRASRAALRSCCDLLQSTVNTVAKGAKPDLDEQHRRFSNLNSKARNAAAAIRIGSDGDRESYIQLVDRIDRLWHALIILDRVGEQQDGAPLPMSDEARSAVEEMRGAAGAALETLAQLQPVPDSDLAELEQVLKRTRLAVKQDFERREHAIEDELRISALVFGLDEISGNIVEISHAIGTSSRGAS